MKTLTTSLFVYEIAAIWSPMPTISEVCRRWPLVGAALGGLVYTHLTRTDVP